MNPNLKQDLTIVISSLVLAFLASLLLCVFTGCTPATLHSVDTSALSGHISKAQTNIKSAESYVDYSDNKAVIIRNLLK
jgi:hypothetical protein